MTYGGGGEFHDLPTKKYPHTSARWGTGADTLQKA